MLSMFAERSSEIKKVSHESQTQIPATLESQAINYLTFLQKSSTILFKARSSKT